MPTKLFYIVQKNLRSVFRNWTTFLLLVLGPLILILTVGYAFSGTDLHDISIGVHAAKRAQIQDVVDSLASENVAVVYFPTIDRCVGAMNRSLVNICADFSSDFGNSSGSITFYYDATRYNLVKFILEYLKDKISITSEQISLEASQQIFSDIDQFVVDMQQGQQQIHEMQQSALSMRDDLVRAHDDILTAQAQFVPRYMKIKDAQAKLNATALSLSHQYTASTNISTVVSDLYGLDSLLTDLNISLTSIHIRETVLYLNTTGDLQNLTLRQTYDALHQLDLIVGYLDDMNTSLSATEQQIGQHITDIDTGVANMDLLSASFDTYIGEFSALNESDAERFLHPITASFVAVPEEVSTNKTALVFPIILVFMICFISILLSNMLVLNETHSPAYFRNFLVPANTLLFILGLFITNIILISLQLVFFFIVAAFSFGVNFFLNVPVFLLAVFLGIVLYVLLGMLFGYLVRDRQTSLLLGLFSALIMFFFSDVVFPLETMPSAASFIAQFNPLVVIEGIFRHTLFYGQSVSAQLFGFSVVCLYIVFFAVLVAAAYYWNRKSQ
ncbi:ABC transporter permease [Candidatus Woesearchaeota archaeon]|nr:ABC transporter permease [Candidatus Woesearchaeota archaeon]